MKNPRPTLEIPDEMALYFRPLSLEEMADANSQVAMMYAEYVVKTRDYVYEIAETMGSESTDDQLDQAVRDTMDLVVRPSHVVHTKESVVFMAPDMDRWRSVVKRVARAFKKLDTERWGNLEGGSFVFKKGYSWDENEVKKTYEPWNRMGRILLCVLRCGDLSRQRVIVDDTLYFGGSENISYYHLNEIDRIG